MSWLMLDALNVPAFNCHMPTGWPTNFQVALHEPQHGLGPDGLLHAGMWN